MRAVTQVDRLDVVNSSTKLFAVRLNKLHMETILKKYLNFSDQERMTEFGGNTENIQSFHFFNS